MNNITDRYGGRRYAMKKAMGMVENLFCAGYLLFALVAGLVFLGRGGTFYSRCAVMTFLLAGGDAFHLIPRIASNLKPEWTQKQFWLGLGNLISSITMTLFYVALAYVMDSARPGVMPRAIPMALIVLSVARVCLCAFPANRWFEDGGNQRWRLYRNLPFLGIGILTVIYLVALYGRWLPAVLVLVSFACYMGTVMGVKKNPKLGMLMIPKTVCYIWMIALFL